MNYPETRAKKHQMKTAETNPSVEMGDLPDFNDKKVQLVYNLLLLYNGEDKPDWIARRIVAAISGSGEEDTERINWIEKEGQLDFYRGRIKVTQEVYYEVTDVEDTLYATGRTLREAIDKARNQK